MKLAEQISGLKIDFERKQLRRYADDEGVARMLSALTAAPDDRQRYEIIATFGSAALQNIFDRLHVDDYRTFLNWDIASLGALRSVGKTKAFEFQLLQRLALNAANQRVGDDETCPPSTQDEPSRICEVAAAKILSRRAVNVLKRLCPSMKPEAILALSQERVGDSRGAGVKVVDEIAEFQLRLPGILTVESRGRACAAEEMKALEAERDKVLDDKGCVTVRQPEEFASLADYVRYPIESRFDLSGAKGVVLRDYMCLQDSEHGKNLREVGEAVGLSFERVRQIAKKMTAALFDKYATDWFAPFKEVVGGWMRERGSIAGVAELASFADARFGWTKTQICSITTFMKHLDVGFVLDDAGVCAIDFNKTFLPRYEAFVAYVNGYTGRISGLGYPEILKDADIAGFPNLTDAEYRLFVRRGMDKNVVVKKTKGKRKVKILRGIKSLAAKQFFASRFGMKYSSRNAGTTPMRKETILEVLEAAGYGGATAEDVFLKAKSRAPQFDWSQDSVRGILSGRWTLDGGGAQVLPYDIGRNVGERTRYSLTSFFMDKKTVAVLEKAGRDVKTYMERTGFGVVSVWKIWRKYRHETALPLPKLGFYMMMRFLKAGGLEYPNYPRIAFPGTDALGNAYQWELYQYFSLCGRMRATFFECISFFVDCLGMQPNIAHAVAFPATGMKHDENDDSAGMLLKMPKKPDRPPNVLLGSVKCDPQENFIAKPERHPIASCYLSEDGRAVNMTTYARLFMCALEAARFSFSNDDVACLTDAAWCRRNLGISTRLLWPCVSGKPAPKYCAWKEPFVFGTRAFQVQSDWEVKCKSKFDAWASGIAACAGIDFVPYDLAQQDESE